VPRQLRELTSHMPCRITQQDYLPPDKVKAVDLVGLLHSEMVYPPEDGHPFKYYPGPTCVNFVYATNSADHYATPPIEGYSGY